MFIADTDRRELIRAIGLVLMGEDNLRLTTFGGVAGLVVALEGRLVSPQGIVLPIAERHVPNSNYTANATQHALAEGMLTNVQLRIATGAAGTGSVFGILELIRGLGPNAQPVGTLLQGYITSNARLAWPGSPIQASTGGAGRIRAITGTDPAAGVNIVETVPAGVRWRLISIQFSLVTSAAVANRSVSILFDDGATIFLTVSDNQVQAASLTHTYCVGAWGQIGLMGGSTHALNIPENFVLSAGMRFRTSVGSMDAGDNLSAPQYVVEEFIE